MTTVRRAWRGRGAANAALGGLAVLLATVACAAPAPSSSTAPPRPTDRLHVQAHDALVRWADAAERSGGALISFVGEMTSQIGDWEASVGDNNKTALMAGLVEAATALPDGAPARDKVKWLDGTTIEVNLLSAAAALEELVAAGDPSACPECQPLLVTEARLATGLVETSRGPAEAPVWVFTIEGTAVRVTRVAVDESITVSPPPWNADDPPAGVSIQAAVGSAESRDLEVVFTGAVEGRDTPCGAGYDAEAVESELAVVVIVVERRNPTPAACTLAGRTRTADVTLASPLGSRAVLEVRQGLPVPLHAP
jgi:hypothetical protein